MMPTVPEIEELRARLPRAFSPSPQERLRRALHGRNGTVAPFNEICTILFRCKMDVSILGSTESARAALNYLLKYLTKDATQVESVLTLLAAARRHVQRFPSRAADSGTPWRFSSNRLLRFLVEQC